jgi:hypothetical protein
VWKSEIRRVALRRPRPAGALLGHGQAGRAQLAFEEGFITMLAEGEHAPERGRTNPEVDNKSLAGMLAATPP